ncbi:hypothetical protein K488DRAFT_81461 [Vararia minispora EC-137]|uniref:Uncharacterized protein n=1 Tax=Vararia minispora EC-137 TaxID=1314806 RepID=A0ACB8QZB7_9AGAM|nr:hypothetical protein K488DRAFT_81461 [Vararia minispora EC-137]
MPDDQQVILLLRAFLDSSALAVLYYEYFTTLPAEIKHVWPYGLSPPTLLFFANRYIPLVGDTAATVFDLTDLVSDRKQCMTLGLVREILATFEQIWVLSLLCLRVIALFRNARPIIVAVTVSAAAVIGLSSWSGQLIRHEGYLIQNPKIPGCHLAIGFMVASRIAIAWGTRVVFDLLAVLLTLYYSLQTRSRQGQWSASDFLTSCIYRDGAIYPIVILIVNLLSVFSLLFAPVCLAFSLVFHL